MEYYYFISTKGADLSPGLYHFDKIEESEFSSSFREIAQKIAEERAQDLNPGDQIIVLAGQDGKGNRMWVCDVESVETRPIVRLRQA